MATVIGITGTSAELEYFAEFGLKRLDESEMSLLPRVVAQSFERPAEISFAYGSDDLAIGVFKRLFDLGHHDLSWFRGFDGDSFEASISSCGSKTPPYCDGRPWRFTLWLAPRSYGVSW